MKKNINIKSLKLSAQELRKKTFLSFIERGETHLGGSFSMTEILIILYKKILRRF